MLNLRNANPYNLSFCYLNINSVRNKFNTFRQITDGNIGIITIAETKIDFFFPSSQFLLEGYHSLYRLSISSNSGGILVYVCMYVCKYVTNKYK